MGITKNGYFSALTNYRDPDMQKEDPPSRGHLVLDYLKEESDPVSYLEEVDEKGGRYNGFNIVAGTLNRLGYYSNRDPRIRVLEPGVYGLSNHLLDTPWPKVRQAKSDFRKIQQKENPSKEALFDLLKNDRPAPEEELPDTGISKELERAVSPIFIKTDNYGTRSSSVVLIDKGGQVFFEERRYEAGTQQVDEANRYEFDLETETGSR